MKQLKSPTLHPEVLFTGHMLITVVLYTFTPIIRCLPFLAHHSIPALCLSAVYHFYDFFGGTIYTRTLNITSTNCTECATKLLASSGSTDHYGTVIYASDVTASDLQIRWMHFAL